MNSKNLIYSKEAKEIFSVFEKNGYEIYIVGGAVRDYLSGLPIHDIDFTTDATPEDIKRLFDKTNNIGERFGTIQVILNDSSFEITTYRTEADYKDSRRPEKVEFSSNLKDDLSRRDFTFNSLVLDSNGAILDFYHGITDLKDNVLRTIGKPENRFNEDKLRKWRAVRFSLEKGFRISDEILKSLINDPNTDEISIERINDELTKIIMSDRLDQGDFLLNHTGLLPSLLNRLFNRSPNNIKMDLINFIVANSLEKDISLRLAALLINSNVVEAEIFLENLKFSKKIIKRVLNYLKFKKTFYNSNNFREMLATFGQENFNHLISLQKAFFQGPSEYIRKSELLGNRIFDNNEPLTRYDLKLNGKDLIELGFEGKEIGETLDYLLERVYENPNLNEKEKLINLLREK